MGKKNFTTEISSEVLTREFVASKLGLIFEDAIVLNSKLDIVAASQCAAELFKCSPEELAGRSLNFLTKDADLASEVGYLLRNGYFRGHCFELMDSKGKVFRAKVSGIYLGLISDFNELIILTVKDMNPTYKLIKKLKIKEAILENLVYRASHDLRGPIATVLGLVNLAKIRQDDKEIDKLLELIATHSKLLDQRLHSLVMKTAAKELKADTRF